MLAREFRLSKSPDINRVFKKGNSCASPFFSIKFFHNPATPTFRMTVIVSNKISKKAVVRNRIKRRIRELVRMYASELAPLHLDMTIMGRNAAETADWHALTDAFGKCVATMKRSYPSVPHLKNPVKGHTK